MSRTQCRGCTSAAARQRNHAGICLVAHLLRMLVRQLRHRLLMLLARRAQLRGHLCALLLQHSHLRVGAGAGRGCVWYLV